MTVDKELISAVIEEFSRVVNKFNRLEKAPVDFGTGDMLTPPEIHLLEAVAKGQGSNVTALCNHFGITKGAISQVVKKMDNLGYLRKERNDDYYKEIILTLTAKGQKAVQGHHEFHQLMDQQFAERLQDLTSEEIAFFRDMLAKIGGHIEYYLSRR